MMRVAAKIRPASSMVMMSGRRCDFGGLIRPGTTQGLRKTCS